jgi:hypothetical protein
LIAWIVFLVENGKRKRPVPRFIAEPTLFGVVLPRIIAISSLFNPWGEARQAFPMQSLWTAP